MVSWLVIRILPCLHTALTAVLASWSGYQYAGPWVSAAPGNPYLEHDRQRTAEQREAARLYDEAWRLLGGTDGSARRPEWVSACRGWPPEYVDSWLEQHRAALDIFDRIAAAGSCRFALAPDAGETARARIDLVHAELRLCLDQAERRRDIEALVRLLAVLDRVGRHALEDAGNISTAMRSLVILREVRRRALRPLSWAELGGAQRTAYVQRLRDLLANPLPTLESALALERAHALWQLYQSRSSGGGIHATEHKTVMALLCPPQRVMGEYDVAYRLVRKMAAQPIEQWLARDNRLWRQLWRRYDQYDRAVRRLWVNLPLLCARRLTPNWEGVLAAYKQTVALDRGTRLVLRITAWRDLHGRWPASLDELPDAARDSVDPYGGGKFVYRRTTDGFLLYSLGPDEDDDGGRAVIDRWRLRPDGDLPIWPLMEPIR